YGCYALDSWNGWFGPKYAAFLHAKRAETELAYPELDGADLQRLQVVCGEVLRPLCIDSKACVVITDTIAGKGLEEKEDNEVGRIVPISASGLEYFVDAHKSGGLIHRRLQPTVHLPIKAMRAVMDRNVQETHGSGPARSVLLPGERPGGGRGTGKAGVTLVHP